MVKVERFENLIAWQKTRELARPIYELASQGSFARDFSLSSQIQRTAVSIRSNIAEGFEGGDRGEFHKFLSTAKASCAEARPQLFVALDVCSLDKASFDQQMVQSEKVARILAGLCAAVDQQRKRQTG